MIESVIVLALVSCDNNNICVFVFLFVPFPTTEKHCAAR